MISTDDLLKYLPDRPVVIEAGAHYGEDTIELAKFATHVHAFEPVPVLYEIALAAVADYPNISLWQSALGEREGIADMWISGGRGDASSSLSAPVEHTENYPLITFQSKPIAVNVVTIETWARSTDVDHIDGAWLDLQGGELAALKAAGPYLDGMQALMVEISYVELYAGCPLWPEVHAWLDEHGFRLAVEDQVSDHQGDALFVR